ncbi:MAG: pentapeptide repeat-containing protein [Myxococcota bacterium]
MRRVTLRARDLRTVDLAQLRLAGGDLRGCDLRGVDLAGRDLARCDLRGADLSGARLAGADLSDTDLDGASLAGADLAGADLRRSAGFGIRGKGLAAEGARLDGAEWRGADLRGARLARVAARGARLDGATLADADFGEARLDRAVLDDADIEGARFTGASLRRAALAGARGVADFAGAALGGADLRLVDLDGCLPDVAAAVRARKARSRPSRPPTPSMESVRRAIERPRGPPRVLPAIQRAARAVWGEPGEDLRPTELGLDLDFPVMAAAREREQRAARDSSDDRARLLALRRRVRDAARVAEAREREAVRPEAPAPAPAGAPPVAAPDPVAVELAAPDPATRRRVDRPAAPRLTAVAAARGVALARASAAGAVWIAQAGGRVLVAGLARGLPAAWGALAEEANAGAAGPSVEEITDFEVEVAARTRALAMRGGRADDRARVAVRRALDARTRADSDALRAARRRVEARDAARLAREAALLAARRKRGPRVVEGAGAAATHWRAAALERERRVAEARQLPRAPGELERRLRPSSRRRPGAALGPGADLARKRLDDADLSGADLSGARLAEASLVGADLRGADLRGADLRGADLTAAQLDGADLTGARLDEAVFDQASLAGVRMEGASLAGARLASVRGLDAAERRSLGARGADVGLEDGRWLGVATGLTAASALVVLGVYLVARFAVADLDRAALEHAAALAAAAGDPLAAAGHFEALAAQTEEAEPKAGYLVEAAGAAEEAGDVQRALDLLAAAITAADGTPTQARARLRRATLLERAGMREAATVELRALLADLTLSPVQRAEVLVGLARALGDAGAVRAEEDALLAGAATSTERIALAIALADAWSGEGHAAEGRGMLERALAGMEPSDGMALRLRLARLYAEDGDVDGALAAYRALVALPGGEEARLGAAEILARRGDVDEARALLAPLVSADGDLGARGRFAAATLADRTGDTDAAVALLREVLAMDGLEPRLADEARLALARILSAGDPEAAAALVGANPELRDAWRLGQAQALRAAGKRAEAAELLEELVAEEGVSEDTRAEAGLTLAELALDGGDAEGAVDRYERITRGTTSADLRRRAQLGLAEALVRLGRVQEAEARWIALLDTNPGDEVAARCRFGLARAAQVRGQTERAAALYLEIGETDGAAGIDALLALATLREEVGDAAGAVEALRLARGRPGIDAARRASVDLSLAQTLAASGDPAADALFAGLLAAPDPEVRAQARVAIAERRLAGDPAGARELLDEALADLGPGPTRAAARGAWLRATVATGAVEEGLRRTDAWLGTENDGALRGELALAATQALRAEGRLEEADALAGRWERDGGFELGMERAGVLRELGRDADAAALFASLVAATPEDDAWRLEGEVDARLAAGDLDGAEAAAARLAQNPTATGAARLASARVARERGDYEGALARLEGVDDPRAPVERATVLEGLGRLDEAEAVWKQMAQAREREPRSAGVLGLARVRLARDDASGALDALAELDDVDPGFALTLAQVRGEALRALGRWAEAREVYAALGGDAERRVVGALGLGECALGEGDALGARARFEEALDATEDPWYAAHALSGVARAHGLAGDRDAAGEALARLRREFPDREDAIASAESALAGAP